MFIIFNVPKMYSYDIYAHTRIYDLRTKFYISTLKIIPYYCYQMERFMHSWNFYHVVILWLKKVILNIAYSLKLYHHTKLQEIALYSVIVSPMPGVSTLLILLMIGHYKEESCCSQKVP
jgi:hypothetical protein